MTPVGELVSRHLADLLFTWVLPALALLVGVVAERRGLAWARAVLAGGVLTGLLWRVLNLVLDRTGPDSIAGLGLCGTLFLIAGVGMGWLVRRNP